MDEQRMILVSPTGTVITGTLETLSGRANIVPGSAREDPLGGIEFDYEGSTEIWWDEQRTVIRDDERVFLDEEGDEFLESELRLVPTGSVAVPESEACVNREQGEGAT
ncbi:MAG: hypothetical protein QOE70_1615 [Chthoniobacter sp.]|jgi:hypothetical protein|nr:hypothetical protein [Chthoniobacter sp.]